VKARLEAIAQRRDSLSREIGRERIATREMLGAVRNDIALAGLGLAVSRLLVRRPWMRALVLGALAAFAAKRVVTGPATAVDSRPAVRRARAGTR
jgi:hypothetical protein